MEETLREKELGLVRMACGAVERIRGEEGRRVGVGEVAREVGVGRGVLGRVWRRVVGVGFGEWRGSEVGGVDLEDHEVNSESLEFSFGELESTDSFDFRSGISLPNISEFGTASPSTIHDTPLLSQLVDTHSPLPGINISNPYPTTATPTTSDLSPILQGPINVDYTVRPTAHGYILIAFKMDAVCIIQIGEHIPELCLALEKKYPL